MMTDKELDGKFKALQDSIEALTKLMTTIIDGQKKEIERNEKKIETLDRRMSIVDAKTLLTDTKVDNHIKIHDETKSGRRFSVEMIVLIVLFAADKIGSWVQQLL